MTSGRWGMWRGATMMLVGMIGSGMSEVAAAGVVAPAAPDPESSAVVETLTIAPLTREQQQATHVKVAAVQITGPWMWFGKRTQGDPPLDAGKASPVDAVEKYVARAAKENVDLIAFPELYLGYFRVPSAETSRVAAAAAAAKMYVAVGCFEILDDAGTFVNSTLLFDRAGKIIGRYSKNHPAIGEAPYLWPPKPDDPEWLMKPGDAYPVFDLDFGRLGIITCYDGYFPESWRVPALKGAEVILWMNARGGAVEDYMVRTASDQNLVHVVTTNKAVGAGTMICEWPAKIRKELTEAKEGYISADLPLLGLRHARKNDRIWRQRRPWLYTDIGKAAPVPDMYTDLPELPGGPPQQIEVSPMPGNVESVKLRQQGLQGSIDIDLASQLWRGHSTTCTAWKQDVQTLEWRTVAQRDDGLSATIHVLPRLDVVETLIELHNGSTQTLALSAPENLIHIEQCADFAGPDLPMRSYSLLDSKKRATNVISARDGKRCIAVAWDAGTQTILPPQGCGKFRGRIYLMHNNEGKLSARHNEDRRVWDAIP